MRKLKERVKEGTLTALEARKELEDAAKGNGDYPRVKDSHTWRWLSRRCNASTSKQ